MIERSVEVGTNTTTIEGPKAMTSGAKNQPTSEPVSKFAEFMEHYKKAQEAVALLYELISPQLIQQGQVDMRRDLRRRVGASDISQDVATKIITKLDLLAQLGQTEVSEESLLRYFRTVYRNAQNNEHRDQERRGLQDELPADVDLGASADPTASSIASKREMLEKIHKSLVERFPDLGDRTTLLLLLYVPSLNDRELARLVEGKDDDAACNRMRGRRIRLKLKLRSSKDGDLCRLAEELR